jgi:hypothetical protein
METPVRLCCGQRHWTVECPDGLVQCCICFARVPEEQLHVLPDGKKENVCLRCEK